MKRTKITDRYYIQEGHKHETYHKVEIKRKDLYSKDYSKIKYSNIEGGERKCSYVNKGIVDVLVRMTEILNQKICKIIDFYYLTVKNIQK